MTAKCEKENLTSEPEYYLGLDMGTSSVGWAVTNPDYTLMRKKGKDLWGTRLFQEAVTAADRRSHRTSRRRKQRQQVRNRLLISEFRQEVEKIDPSFFMRLEDSRFILVDKRIAEKHTLFNDPGFTDKEYYDQYPTIYHLRNKLLHSEEKPDIREVFLGLLSLFNHRGHFLDNGSVELDREETGSCLAEIASYFSERQIDIPLESNQERILNILTDSRKTRKDKERAILDILKPDRYAKKMISQFVKLITGQKAKLGDLAELEDKDSVEYKYSFSFREKQLEDILPDVEGAVDGEFIEFLTSAYSLYSKVLLDTYMKDDTTGKFYEYLSDARIAAYEKHGKDLKKLKTLVKKYIPEQYDGFFRKMEPHNYSHYIGSTQSEDRRYRTGKAKQEDFYKAVNNLLKQIPDCPEKEDILKEVAEGVFLLKQTGPQNGFISHQLQLKELKKILRNAAKHYDFLSIKDERGLTATDRIEQLFSFKIPYYVGPLKKVNGTGNGWAVRKSGQENTSVRPWNFEEVIDEKASADLFIKNLVRSCTYLQTEKVLPKCSLLYEEFAVLNELNNLKINGISPDELMPGLKMKIYEECFLPGKKVTGKKVEKLLRGILPVRDSDELILTGIDRDFNNTLSSQKKFRELFGVETLSDKQRTMAEQIIEWSTVYGDSRKFLRQKLKEEYPELADSQIRRILGFKFSDWGNLSRAFLEMEGYQDEVGNPVTIIRALRETDKNLMQLLTTDSPFTKELERRDDYVTRDIWSIQPEELKEMNLSAPVRRMIWQTLLIVRELESTIGYAPRKVFLEMARGEQEKKRTVSRKRQLQNLYKAAGFGKDDILNELDSFEERDLKSKKLYLYFRQMGKDIYTGKRIDIDDLLHGDRYDIDHIHPQSKKKDDSIENNLVLTSKQFNNQEKGDKYPISSDVQARQYGFWNLLRQKGFMSQEKYNRLTRTTEFTDSELAEFVNRQLVETRQGTKAVIGFFKQCFPDSELVYVKAGNVSDFRKQFDIPKCRELNNFHHAVDAYLNIVVGNVYDVKFTKNPINFIKKKDKDDSGNKYNMKKMFEFNVRRGNQTAWIADNGKSLQTVKKVAFRNTPLVTKRTFEQSGGLSNAVLSSATDAKPGKYLPVKTTDKRLSEKVGTYGGYSDIKGSYFFLVQYRQGQNTIRSIESVPSYLKESMQTKQELEEYCRSTLKMKEPDVRICRIPMYSVLKLNGYYYYLTGRTNNYLSLSNALEMALSIDFQKHIKTIAYIVNGVGVVPSMNEKELKEKNCELYEILIEKHQSTVFSKRVNRVGPKLEKYKERFREQNLENQCKALMQILKLTSTNFKTSADLKNIGGSGQEGVMSISKQFKIGKYGEFCLIYQSPTGIYETKKDLQTI